MFFLLHCTDLLVKDNFPYYGQCSEAKKKHVSRGVALNEYTIYLEYTHLYQIMMCVVAKVEKREHNCILTPS